MLALSFLASCSKSDKVYKDLSGLDFTRLANEASALLEHAEETETEQYETYDPNKILKELDLEYLESLGIKNITSAEDGIFLVIAYGYIWDEGSSGLYIHKNKTPKSTRVNPDFVHLYDSMYFFVYRD